MSLDKENDGDKVLYYLYMHKEAFAITGEDDKFVYGKYAYPSSPNKRLNTNSSFEFKCSKPDLSKFLKKGEMDISKKLIDANKIFK